MEDAPTRMCAVATKDFKARHAGKVGLQNNFLRITAKNTKCLVCFLIYMKLILEILITRNTQTGQTSCIAKYFL